MIKLHDDLGELVSKQIEDRADPTALARLREALAALPHQERAAIESAAIQLAGAWSDAALWVGFQMAKDPGAWIFQPAE